MTALNNRRHVSDQQPSHKVHATNRARRLEAAASRHHSSEGSCEQAAQHVNAYNSSCCCSSNTRTAMLPVLNCHAHNLQDPPFNLYMYHHYQQLRPHTDSCRLKHAHAHAPQQAINS
jgi:hypothetical protein